MGWEQRNADFCKAQTDAQMAYIEAEREVDQLQTENDRLREEVRYLKKGDVLHVLTDQELAEQQKHEREMQASINALDDENVKLRELVNVFYHCTTSGYCDECPVNGGGRVHLMPDTICDTLHDRMRELGVEP